MKHIYEAVAALALLTTACGGKQTATVEEEQQRVLQIDSVDTHSGIQRMKTTTYEDDVKLAGHNLHIQITRQPDEEAAVVKSEVGTYVDNKVTLTMTRDGAAWVNRTIRKSAFAAITGQNYAAHFIFEGMVYDEERSTVENAPVFAASISVPLTDLYIPYIVRITSAGDVQIVRDEDMDVLPEIDDSI